MEKKIILFVFLVLGTIYLTACSSSKEEMSSEANESFMPQNPTFTFNTDEKGNKVYYQAEFAGDSIQSLLINGKKIPHDKIKDYENLVYQKMDNVKGDRNFTFRFGHPQIDLKEFKTQMKKFEKDKKINLSSKILNKELLKKSLAKAREELENVKIKKFHFDFDKDNLEDEIKNLNNELENLDLNFNLNVDIDIDMDKIKSEIDKAMDNIKDVHINMETLDKDLKKLDSFIDEMKSELVKDNLIDSADEKVDIELNSNEMNVNGKKVDGQLLDKYKKMYKEHFGKELEDKQSFEMH